MARTPKSPIAEDDESRLRPTRRGVDDELKIQWALERHASIPVEIAELARKYGRDKAVISRAISRAFAEGLVVLKRADRDELRGRRQDIEDALRRRYPKLLSAVVLEDTPSTKDPLHERLGEAFARALLDEEFQIRHRESIAIGSGRSIFHFAARLSSGMQRLKQDAVEIRSLCGDSYPFHDDSRNVCLDADGNVNQLFRSFPSSARMVVTSRPIFMTEADSAWYAEYFDNRWKNHPPSLAISGIGVFDEDHQLVQLCDQNRRENFPPTLVDPELQASILCLNDLSTELREILALPHYIPVAEIGMYLFTVPPPCDLTEKAAAVLAEIKSRVVTINLRLFAPHLAHLDCLPSIVIIGGGESKAGAIAHLLDGTLPLPDESGEVSLSVSTICTDATCANLLLRNR